MYDFNVISQLHFISEIHNYVAFKKFWKKKKKVLEGYIMSVIQSTNIC